MISNYEGLMETLGYATDSAGAAQEQFDKTVESLESKINGLNNAWTEFTTGIASQGAIKGVVDTLSKLLNIVNRATGSFGSFGTPLARTLVMFGALRLAGGALGSTLLLYNPMLTNITDKTGTLSSMWTTSLIPQIIKLNKLFVNGTVAINTTTNGVVKLTKAQLAAALAGKANTAVTNKEALAYLKEQGVVNSLTLAFYQLGAAKLAAIGAVAVVMGAIIALVKYFKNQNQKAKKTIEENSELIEEYNKKIEKLSDILNKDFGEDAEISLDKLIKGTDKFGNNISLTTDELAKYDDLVQNLVDIEFGDSIEDVNKKLHEQADAVTGVSNVLLNYKNKMKQQKQENAKQILEEYDSATSDLPLKYKYISLSTPYVGTARGIDMNYLNQYTRDPDKQLFGKQINKYSDDNFKYFVIESWEDVTAYEDYVTWLESNNAPEKLVKRLNRALQKARDELKEYDKELGKVTSEIYTQDKKRLIAEIDAGVSNYADWGLDINAFAEGLMGENWIDLDSDTRQKLFDIASNFGSFELGDTLIEPIKDALQADIKDTSSLGEYYSKLGSEIEITVKSLIGNDVANLGITSIEDKLGQRFLQGFYNAFGYVADREELYKNWEGVLRKIWEKMGKATNEFDLVDFAEGFSLRVWRAIQTGGFSQLLADDSGFDWESITNQEELDKELNKILDERLKVSEVVYRFSDEVQKAWEDITDIDTEELEAGLDASGKINKNSIAFERLTDDFKNFNNALDGVILTTDEEAQELAGLFIQAQNNDVVWEKLIWQFTRGKILAMENGKAIVESMKEARAYAWTAAQAMNYLKEHQNDLTTEAYNQIKAYAALISFFSEEKSITKEDKAEKSTKESQPTESAKSRNYASQDAFYNYITILKQYEDELERLQRQQDLLTDPDQIRENIRTQEEEYGRAIGATQGYLNETSAQLEKLRQKGLKQYSAYVQIAEDGSLRLTQAYFGLTGDAAEAVDNWIEAYDDVLGRQRELNEQLDEYKQDLMDLYNDWRDAYIDLVDELAGILKEADEKALDEKKEYYDKLEEQADEYLEAIRKNIEAERKLRDKNNKYEEIAQKQRRLALLQRDTSGRYASEIQGLQEEVSTSQQEMADDYIDELLDQLGEQNDDEAKRHKEVLDQMQKQIDDNVETRRYIEQAQEIIAQGEDAILATLQSGQDFQQASDAERQRMLEEWGTTIGKAQTYWNNIQQGITNASMYIEAALNSAAANIISHMPVGNVERPLSGNGDTTGREDNPTSQKHWFESTLSFAGLTAKAQGSNQQTVENAVFQAWSRMWSREHNGEQPQHTDIIKKKIVTVQKYKKGGLVDFTGPAWVDGTRSSPEAFLNANQTSIIGNFASLLEKLVGNSFAPAILDGASSCNINIDIGNLGVDYDIDNAIAKVKKEILNATQYRNVNILKRNR